jgi:hypothetical protein
MLVCVRVLHDEPGFGIAVQRNVALALWRDSPRPEWFKAIRATTWPYAEQGPGGAAGWVNLIVAGTPRFSEEIRREATEISKREDIYQLGTAHIVTFDASARRSSPSRNAFTTRRRNSRRPRP